MRDIFTEIFESEPVDPVQAARRSLRAPQRARFYGKAEVAEAPDGFQVLLDGKPIRTPARNLLAAPRRKVAEAIAAEWHAQDKVIDPASMPLTRLANSIIDGVAPAPQPVAAEIEKYLGTDLVFYRAEGPDGLLARQARHWDPLVEWAHEALGARFILAQGVVFAQQPQAALAAARAAIPDHAWRLGALSSITTLTGSALIALALDGGKLTPDEAWAAAHVDEDWNMDFWGRDAIALERRDFRRRELDAAATVLSALRV